MKRTLALAALGTAAAFAPTTAAGADHLCVTSHGQPIACAPHPEEPLPTGSCPANDLVPILDTNPYVCVYRANDYSGYTSYYVGTCATPSCEIYEIPVERIGELISDTIDDPRPLLCRVLDTCS